MCKTVKVNETHEKGTEFMNIQRNRTKPVENEKKNMSQKIVR